MKNKNIIYIILAYFLLILFYDLGNPDAITQGTEGFYLQIAKEMAEKNSWLTPYYHNLPHWSKPPIHFWISMPFNMMIKGHHLLISRIVMLMVSFLGIFLLSNWLKKHFSIKKIISLFFFFSTLGILKYSRIFMMEITLTVFNFVSIIYLYDYLTEKKNKDLLISALFLAAATLVKGPISIVMCGITCAIYFFNQKNKIEYIKLLLKFFTLTGFLSSLWFIACYIKYGQYFIEYFFIRENMGKFSSRAYPISSVINGLLLYGFPWTFLLPTSIYIYLKKFKNKQLKNIEIFLMSSFLGYYLIWFIPNQKSYHYAIPALPYLLILILNSVNTKNFLENVNNKFKIFFNYSILGISSLFLFLMILATKIAYSDKDLPLISIILCLLISLSSLLYFCRAKNILNKSIAIYIFNTITWIVFVPNFYLPLIPNNIVTFLANKNNISAYYKKSYFIEEKLNKKIQILNQGEISSKLINTNQLIIIQKEMFNKFKLQNNARIIKVWNKWKRGNKTKKILSAIKKGDLQILKEKMYIITGKEQI